MVRPEICLTYSHESSLAKQSKALQLPEVLVGCKLTFPAASSRKVPQSNAVKCSAGSIGYAASAALQRTGSSSWRQACYPQPTGWSCLQAAVADNLLDRLQDCRRYFPTVAVVGGPCASVLQRLAAAERGVKRILVVDDSPAVLRQACMVQLAEVSSIFIFACKCEWSRLDSCCWTSMLVCMQAQPEAFILHATKSEEGACCELHACLKISWQKEAKLAVMQAWLQYSNAWPLLGNGADCSPSRLLPVKRPSFSHPVALNFTMKARSIACICTCMCIQLLRAM